MSNADEDMSRRAEQPGEVVSRPAGVADELTNALAQMAGQFEEAERRQADVLQQIEERLASLRADASPPRAGAPAWTASSEGPGISGRAANGASITESSGAAAIHIFAGATGRSGRMAPPVDPFDIVDTSVRASAGEPWDREQAETLTQVYEAEAPGLVRRTPGPETRLPVERQDHLSVPAPAAGARNGPDREPQWLETRFVEIAARIEASLAGIGPESSLRVLGERLEQFERRVGSALEAVATRSDVVGLRIVEAHVTELATQLEQAKQQLGRLDGIEEQLRSVIEQLSDQRLAALDNRGAGPADGIDHIAMRTAEEVAARFADLGTGGPQLGRLDELKALLESLMSERRQGEDQTVSMLDTLQQALIRVLDRIDDIDIAQQRAPLLPVGGRVWPDAAPHPAGELGSAQPEPGFGATAADDHLWPSAPGRAFEQHTPLFSFAPDTEPLAGADSGAPMRAPLSHDGPALPMAMAPAGAAECGDGAGSAIEVLRRNFIADAQRARAKAASARPELTEPKVARAASVPAPGKPPAGGSGGRILGLSPKLLVSALALVVAINGALLLLRKPAEAPAPGTVTAPSSGAKVPPEQSVPPKEADRPRSDASKPATVTDGGAAAAQGPGHFEIEPETVVEEWGFEGQPPGQASSGDSADAGRFAPVPLGITLQRSEVPASGESLARLHRQQAMANLSGKLGAAAAKATLAALLPESAGPAPTGRLPADTTGGGARSSVLDLPPATVGPLSLRLAAANGDPSAEFEVGARLAEGKGTTQDFKEAIRWYQRSAAQGFAQSQYRLAALYERGLGTKADMKRARVWYERAAEQGNVKAMHNLAVLGAGRETGSPDYATAARWFSEAAERGLQDSQYNLAVLIENGLGVPRDPVGAYKWYSLAGRGGDAEAVRRRDAIKAKLSAADLAAAETLVSAYNPKAADPIVNDARVAGEDWKQRSYGG